MAKNNCNGGKIYCFDNFIAFLKPKIMVTWNLCSPAAGSSFFFTFSLFCYYCITKLKHRRLYRSSLFMLCMLSFQHLKKKLLFLLLVRVSLALALIIVRLHIMLQNLKVIYSSFPSNGEVLSLSSFRMIR